MLAVMIIGIFSKGDMVYEIPDYSIAADFGGALLSALLTVSKEVGIAIGLIVGFFIALDLIFLKLPLKKLKIIGGGVIYTFIGLLIFLTAAQIGFMPIGYKIGCELGAGDNFVAAYLACMTRDLSVAQSLEIASRAAARCVAEIGATTARYRFEDLL